MYVVLGAIGNTGYVVAKKLKLDFRGTQTREAQGQRDLDYTEATTIIGKAIGKPRLAYVHLPDDQVRAAMVQMGMSETFARLVVEMGGRTELGITHAGPRAPHIR
jgi:uncharacterized protein YbjT (DUF2867 family)